MKNINFEKKVFQFTELFVIQTPSDKTYFKGMSVISKLCMHTNIAINERHSGHAGHASHVSPGNNVYQATNHMH